MWPPVAWAKQRLPMCSPPGSLATIKRTGLQSASGAPSDGCFLSAEFLHFLLKFASRLFSQANYRRYSVSPCVRIFTHFFYRAEVSSLGYGLSVAYVWQSRTCCQAPPRPYSAGSSGVSPEGSQTYTQSPSEAQLNSHWASPVERLAQPCDCCKPNRLCQ